MNSKGDVNVIATTLIVSAVIAMAIITFLWGQGLLNVFQEKEGSNIQDAQNKDELEFVSVQMSDENQIERVFIRNTGNRDAESVELFIAETRACNAGTITKDTMFDFNSTNCPDLNTITVDNSSLIRVSTTTTEFETHVADLR